MVSLDHPSSCYLHRGHDDDCPKQCEENFSDCYELMSELGRGRFAKVSQVHHRTTGATFAAKIIRRWRNGKDTHDNVLRELRVIAMGTASPYIVDMYQYFLRDRDIVIILEHAIGGDLYNLVHFGNVSLSVLSVRSIIEQVLKALVFLHDRRIVHLDIKPDNILLRRPFPDLNVALCDFGLARYLDEQNPVRDLVGTPDYVAPEILDYDPIHLTTDIWSVGVLTYYLLTGISPFWAENKEQTYMNVTQLFISYPEDLFAHIPACVVQFIRRLLVKKPSDRPSASECVQDAWFVDICEDAAPGSISSPTSSKILSLDKGNSLPRTATDSSRIDLDRSLGEC